MVVPRFEQYERVHETDYGEPAFGSVVLGFVLLVVGLVQTIVSLFRRARS